MKVIFLDIDGVLNGLGSESRCCGCLGIDDDKVKRLAKIINETDACIVLSSTWRHDWERVESLEDLSTMGAYMVRKLKRERIHILSKTDDISPEKRGVEIKKWLDDAKKDGVEIKSFCIIDDEMFDFEAEGLIDYLVKTSFYEDDPGLQDSHVERAIEILNSDTL